MSRSIELLLVLLLAAFTAGVVLQVKNQRLLNEILVELQRREPVAATNTPAPPPPATPDVAPKPTDKPPKIDLINIPPVTPTTPTDPVTDQLPTPPSADPPTPQQPVPSPTATPEATSTPAVAEPDDAAHWKRHGATVETVVGELLSGGYEKVIGRLDPPTRFSMDRDTLAAAFDPIIKEHGGLKRIAGHRVVPAATTATVTVFAIDAELADGFVQGLTILVDKQQRIAGLLLGKPGEAG